MSIKIVARNLLNFLHQNEDFETQLVLKTLAQPPAQVFKNQVKSAIPTQGFTPPILHSAAIPAPAEKKQATKIAPSIAPSLSIYDKLAEKVKKACPELHIKEHFHSAQNLSIPDCDVIILAQATIPQVYQALAKAIDKQLALTETVLLESNFMQDLLTKSYKLILAVPEAKHIPSFMQHVKVTGKKDMYIGASPLIFLEDPVTLSTNISNKQTLWQTIKALIL